MLDDSVTGLESVPDLGRVSKKAIPFEAMPMIRQVVS
jgi:hypothetical protein